jgi:hypothetical protein
MKASTVYPVSPAPAQRPGGYPDAVQYSVSAVPARGEVAQHPVCLTR